VPDGWAIDPSFFNVRDLIECGTASSPNLRKFSTQVPFFASASYHNDASLALVKGSLIAIGILSPLA
jgi:hypothetical protein